MKLDFRRDRSRIVVATTLGLVALGFTYIVLHFLMLRSGFVDEIDNIQPRTARLLGMLESADQLGAASGAARELLGDIAYAPGRDAATAAAALQSDVRELMADAGLSVTGSQILDTRAGEGYDRLQLDVTAEGNVDALDEALSGLEELRPLVFVESVKVKPIRTRRRRGDEVDTSIADPRNVNARFTLFALRLQN
jgi:general secretion pathway protein M